MGNRKMHKRAPRSPERRRKLERRASMIREEAGKLAEEAVTEAKDGSPLLRALGALFLRRKP